MDAQRIDGGNIRHTALLGKSRNTRKRMCIEIENGKKTKPEKQTNTVCEFEVEKGSTQCINSGDTTVKTSALR